MNWTKTPPTEPGKYYWKRCIDSVVWFVRDLISMGRLGLGDNGELLENIGGLWGGRVPAPGTTWNVEQIKTWMDDFDKPEIRIKHPTKYNNPQALIDDPQSGLAATTARHRKEQR